MGRMSCEKWKFSWCLLLAFFSQLSLPVSTQAQDPNVCGFLYESYIEEGGTAVRERRCPLAVDGNIIEAECEPWRRVALFVDGTPRGFTGYDSYVYYPNGEAVLQESMLEDVGARSWGRICPLVDGYVQWDDCGACPTLNGYVQWGSCPAWGSVDLSPLGYGPFGAYGDYTTQRDGEKNLTQSLLSADGLQGWFRICATKPDGSIDWNGCANSWRPASNPVSFIGYGAYSFWSQGQEYVKQVLIWADGYSEYSRTCKVYNGSVDWKGCEQWFYRDLRTLVWAPDQGGHRPTSFTSYGAGYYTRYGGFRSGTRGDP